MTDHPQNDRFHASSFMQRHNAENLDQMFARFANDPYAVDVARRTFFRAMGEDAVSVKREADGRNWARTDWPSQPGDEMTQARPEGRKAMRRPHQSLGSPLTKRSGSGAALPRRWARGTLS